MVDGGTTTHGAECNAVDLFVCFKDDEAERLEEMVERQQALDKLAAAIEALEADERALVTLRYYDDRSVAECAAITGLTEANVKVRLHRIRKKLYAMITSATNEYK